MGLLKGGINEVIATTAFNAAPIGIHYREKKYHAVLFLGSHTAENIARDGWVVANFVHDPVLYVKTAFEDLPQEHVHRRTGEREDHAPPCRCGRAGLRSAQRSNTGLLRR